MKTTPFMKPILIRKNGTSNNIYQTITNVYDLIDSKN